MVPWEMYRGYLVNIERIDGHWHAAATPIRPDLPILAEYSTAFLRTTEPEATAAIKRRIDQLLR
jgi:hypothetical protein